MKKFLIVLAVLFVAAGIYAEEEKIYKNGSFVGPAFKEGVFNQKGVFLAGGRAAWLINGFLTIGGAGYGTIPELEKNVYNYYVWYGGPEIGFIVAPENNISMTVSMLAGVGWVGRRGKHNVDYPPEETVVRSDMFFALEPSVGILINTAESATIEVSLSYVFSGGIEMSEISDMDFKGITLGITTRFTIF